MSSQKITPALKDSFSEELFRQIADEACLVSPKFARQRFLAHCKDHDELSLMARVRRVAESLHQGLSGSYRENLEALYLLAPRLKGKFSPLILPEYVALYGLEDFEASMAALKFFTTFGTSEYGVRHFLQRDLLRTLSVMEAWAYDENEHVRRLASEGCRPRLPWSFQLQTLREDPGPLGTIIDALNNDPSPYVRRSVANNLNDISKDNPEWVLERIESWPLENPGTAWIAKHALRTLVKNRDVRALTVVGAGSEPQVKLSDLSVTPSVRLGEVLELSFRLTSTAIDVQRLVIDYVIYYVKRSGACVPKVFKLRTLELEDDEFKVIRKRQMIANFSTRTHYAGRHEIEILVNGRVFGKTSFDLRIG